MAYVPEPAGATHAAVAGVSAPRWPGRVARYGTVPFLIALALVLLYIYISAQELDSIETRLLTQEKLTTAASRHLWLTTVSTVFVIAIAVPLGIMLTRPLTRRATPLFLGLANSGQTVPSIGVLVLFALWFGIGFKYTIIALVAYAILPVLRNTMVGLEQVDPFIIEAGRGMGLTKLGVLTRLELPLAVPVILAGVRTALIINVGTATLATFVNGGGLGNIINGGLTSGRDVVTFTGAVLTAAFALSIDWLAGIAEDFLKPKGL
ncbi:MAG: ABC transporter permease [Actinomycetota bacterium]|nr:ABC transporter permease [Actinomycetota bacterium]